MIVTYKFDTENEKDRWHLKCMQSAEGMFEVIRLQLDRFKRHAKNLDDGQTARNYAEISSRNLWELLERHKCEDGFKW